MFTIKNLRKEKHGKWTRLVVDLDVTGIENPFEEKTIWVAVENKNAGMLTDDVYDGFAPFLLYLGMHYHQDVHIEGKMSPRLYHNITHYLMSIFDGFSKYTQPINFTADGFKKTKKGPVDLVGTSISCGVDSLTTIYDNFIEEKDDDFRINSLFFFNCGTHGEYEDKKTREIWLDRAKLNKKAADELGLPMFLVDSNMHAFTYKVGQSRLGFVAIYCCALCLQRYIKRYLTSSSGSYDSCSEFSLEERDVDMSCYCETYMPHLISTEGFELVIDGCQYTRPEKVERICDWNIARKYLNVCLDPMPGGKNCSICQKCMRTLIVLDTIGKLVDYRRVFDIDLYRNNKYAYLCWLKTYKRNAQGEMHIKYLKKNDVFIPNSVLAKVSFLNFRAMRKIKKILNIYDRERELKV